MRTITGQPPSASSSRIATASIVGTTLEYFDFAVYNTLAALIFNRLFFPSFDPLSGTFWRSRPSLSAISPGRWAD